MGERGGVSWRLAGSIQYAHQGEVAHLFCLAR